MPDPLTPAVVHLTLGMLARAPREASGIASSMRKATWTLGGVRGGALIGYVSFGAFQSRLSDLLIARGEPVARAEELALAIRDGAVVDELALLSTDPVAREALFSKGPALLEAQSHTVFVMGGISAGVYLLAAVLMVWYVQRSRTLSQ